MIVPEAAKFAKPQHEPPKQASAHPAQANAQASQLVSQANNSMMQRPIQQIDNTISQAIQSTQSNNSQADVENSILNR